jgi:hypothetical protein
LVISFALWTVYETYLADDDLDTFAADAEPYENHAWNEAYIDGGWVILDPTWGSGNEFRLDTVNSVYVYTTGASTDEIYDVDLDDFSAHHVFWHEQADELLLDTAGGQVLVEAALEPEDVAAGETAFVASYNDVGRMLDVAIVTVDSASITTTLDDPAHTDTVQLCVTDAEGCPVAECYDGTM